MNPCTAPSKRNSVSPPTWEQSSEEDQPLDFSRASSDDSSESKKTNGKAAKTVVSPQDLAEACAKAGMFLTSTSPRNTSPHTISPDHSDAELSDGVTKLPSPLMFQRLAQPTALSPSEHLTAHDLLNPAFLHNPLYFPYPQTMSQMDPALLHANSALMDPNYQRFRLQRIQQASTVRRKLPPSSPSPPPGMNTSDTLCEMSEHSNDSHHISTSSLTPGPGSPKKNQGSGRRRGKAYPEEMKDEAYWERRRKNNEAAKRSRDARRAKEDETAIRAAFLEEENLKLRVRNAALENELAKLRCILYTHTNEK